MKKVLWIFASAFLLSNVFLSTSCKDDTTDDLAPIVVVKAGPTPDKVVGGTGTEVTVTVEATKGTADLESLLISDASGKLDVADITVNGSTPAGNAILLVSPADVETWVITIKVTADPGTATYTVKVQDKGGLSDETSFDLKVETPVAEITGATIQLWNAAGPVGTGGIDLDNGASTGTKLSTGGDDSYLQAELRDMGIDSLAGSGDNWRRRLGGINGTEVRYVGNIGSSADFGAVASKEGIVDIFDAADALTETLPTWGSFTVSSVVVEGDVFAVYKSSTETYYLVLVEDITETTALGDNTDNYLVSIKY
ncbi:MAG: hypothetical protein HY842_19460 [Bacteroidetes bacterium]|nr:hypothetical protein [Bacteroidota bacterium]